MLWLTPIATLSRDRTASNQSISQRPHCEINSARLPRHPAVAYLFLVRLPYGYRYSCVMRPLRYSINVTLDGCCDHRAMLADEDLHRHAVENLNRADALLFGRVTYEMMEAAWRPSARTGAIPDGMEPFAPDDRRGKEVRRVEHPGAGRLERGARARGSGEGRSEAQAGIGQGAVCGRREAPDGVGGAGIDR